MKCRRCGIHISRFGWMGKIRLCPQCRKDIINEHGGTFKFFYGDGRGRLRPIKKKKQKEVLGVDE